MHDTDRGSAVPRSKRHALGITTSGGRGSRHRLRLDGSDARDAAVKGASRTTLLMFVAAGVVAAAFPISAGAQQQPSWSTQHVDESLRPELDGISARGRLLAEYDQAAWHGTDAVLSLRPDRNLIGGYLARRRADGLWEVVFGKMDAAGDAFVIAYRAVQRAAGDTSYIATALDPRERDAEWYARAGRALDVARAAFGSANRPYNAMAIPASDDGEWFVYLVPAPTRPGVFPLGGDTRYRVSQDGRTVLMQRRLHNTILEYGAGPRPEGKIEAGTHTAVLDDRPEDTDVFHVLSRDPRVPEYIVSRTYFFRVDLDGRITAYKHDGKP
jgi:hypothetical protein